MDVKELILKRIHAKGRLTVSEIVKETGFSRAYIQRVFKSLVDTGKIFLVGRANVAHYVTEPNKIHKAKIIRELKNKDLSEGRVWDSLKSEGLFKNMPTNTMNIVGYAFTEILNNAIEHSSGKEISIRFEQKNHLLSFDVNDDGVGILNNIRKKLGLKNNKEAIQDLLKGKQTTMPEAHSGEGLFFTSRIADKMVIYASEKKIIFDNNIGDVFVKDNPKRKGTRVRFEIKSDTKKKLNDVFKKYTGESFEFGKTEVLIELYKMGSEYISRSQARRVLVGLDKFKTIVLDFNKIKTIGQGFADEVFRVWQNRHPQINVEYKNANDNVELMIQHVIGNK
jgi:anti-sigma regulatory factor (Ser/Thr protein kinase)